MIFGQTNVTCFTPTRLNFLLVGRYFLFLAPYCLLIARCSLLFTPLLVTFCLFFVTFCSSIVTFRSLLVTFCSLFGIFYSLLDTICSLLITFCSFRIFRQVSQQLTRKTSLIFCLFAIILSICCSYLVVYYLTKPLWNCISASEICCSGCCSLSLSLSVWPSM